MNPSSRNEFPSVAVIMLNWNTPEMTVQAVRSVLASDYENFSVHLTDNGSRDNSYSIFQKTFDQKVNVYRLEKNQGYVGGMNFCLKQGIESDPHYFLIMNNDVIIDPKAMSALVETAKRYNDECVVTGKVYFYDEPKKLQTVGNEFNRKTMEERRIGFDETDEGQYDSEVSREMIDDIFMLLPASIYKEVGGYCTYFYLNYEQTDLILRIRDKGYKVIYTPEAKLLHKGSFSTGGLGNPYMMYWEGKSHLIIHKLYQNRNDFTTYYFVFLYKIVWSLCKQLIKALLGQENKIKAATARFRGFIAGTIWLFNRKEESGYNPYQT